MDSTTRVAIVALVIYLTALCGGTFLLGRTLGLGGDGLYFNVQRWETEQVISHAMFRFRDAMGLETSGHEDGDTLVQEFLDLTAEIRRLDSEVRVTAGSDKTANDLLDQASDRRDEIENEVELIVAGRVGDAIEEVGLTTSFPLFGDFAPAWPPVIFEFDGPPQVLAISPRERIELRRSDLLDPDLGLEAAIELEREYEDRGLSALVEEVGGVGTYPSTIRPRTTYESTLEVVAHEWLHNYLFFYPLGFSYFSSQELRTLNETVANIAGAEIRQVATELYPLPPAAEPSAAADSSQDEPALDFRETMRALRLEVDALLADGRVETAEGRMEEVRLQLVDAGFLLRKINQAYFAFNGSYGDTPQSSSPIGPKLAQLRADSGSLEEFLRRVRELTSEEELDEELAAG